MQTQTSIPLAYFITFTCYGTWLHVFGEKKLSVDRRHNIPETDFLPPNPHRETSAKKRMVEPPYLLGDTQRQVVLNAIKEVCIYREWVLLAAHVRTNHIHFVVHALDPPEVIMNTVKAYASRHLNQLSLDDHRIKRWTRHGSTRYLWKDEEVESTITYVVHEQGEAMAVFENYDRVSFGRAVITP